MTLFPSGLVKKSPGTFYLPLKWSKPHKVESPATQEVRQLEDQPSK